MCIIYLRILSTEAVNNKYEYLFRFFFNFAVIVIFQQDIKREYQIYMMNKSLLFNIESKNFIKITIVLIIKFKLCHFMFYLFKCNINQFETF